MQVLNLSYYPQEHGPYNTDAENIDDEGRLLNPEKRWGGIMRKMDITDFDNSNIEYLQFWLMDPFLYNEDGSNKGGMLYFNFGEVSEDILKDGMKSYENGLPINNDTTYLTTTVWGKVSRQQSLTYAFDNSSAPAYAKMWVSTVSPMTKNSTSLLIKDSSRAYAPNYQTQH